MSCIPGAFVRVPGAVIGGHWTLERPLGEGGMGEVWVATHRMLEVEAALKVLRPPTDAALDREEMRCRFHLEARIACMLARRTRHVVEVIDHGIGEPEDYLVMELLQGSSLDDVLNSECTLGGPSAADLVTQIARGLSAAHEAQVLHRDLKPANLFVTRDEEGGPLVKILDFGIAKAPSRYHGFSTCRGRVMGTPWYMSPEQARGLVLDRRTDVWSLGVIAFELLTGRLPFHADDPSEVLALIASGRSPLPRASACCPALGGKFDELFRAAFDRDIDRRFQDAMSFASALASVVASSVTPPTSRASVRRLRPVSDALLLAPWRGARRV